MFNCSEKESQLMIEVYETSENGNQLERITEFTKDDLISVDFKINPEEHFQTILHFDES